MTDFPLPLAKHIIVADVAQYYHVICKSAPVLSTMVFEIHSPTLTTWVLSVKKVSIHSEAGVQSQIAELG